MKKVLIAALLVMSATISAANAETFDYSFVASGGLADVVGQFDAVNTANGWQIISMTGTLSGPAIGTPEPLGLYGNPNFPGSDTIVGPDSTISYNNRLYPATVPYVDAYGVAFFASGDSFNIYYEDDAYYLKDVNNIIGSPGVTGAFAVSASAVPEPSTWAMITLGFAGLTLRTSAPG